MLGRLSGKIPWFWIVLGGVPVVVGIIMLSIRPASAPTTTANTTNSNRQRYASLYDAAWRQDDGRDATLVTATLFVPPTIEALGADAGRSSTEEQLWNAMKSLDAKTIPIVLTFDSVTNASSDQAITDSLELQADGKKLPLQKWQPMIAPTRIVNTSGTTSSQIGVALFTADQEVDWQTIGTLTLTVSDIGGEKERIFTWVEPKLLLQL